MSNSQELTIGSIVTFMTRDTGVRFEGTIYHISPQPQGTLLGIKNGKYNFNCEKWRVCRITVYTLYLGLLLYGFSKMIDSKYPKKTRMLFMVYLFIIKWGFLLGFSLFDCYFFLFRYVVYVVCIVFVWRMDKRCGFGSEIYSFSLNKIIVRIKFYVLTILYILN